MASAGNHMEHRPKGRWTSRALFAALAAGLVAVTTVGVTQAARSDKFWWDNLSGPDSSNFVGSTQITKSNVGTLQVAWSYPYATPGFNPIVVDDVMYVAGRGNSLIALDANTGKELWIHEGLAGSFGRGINYWQSEDGKDKRLIFWVNSFMQEIDARTGKSIMSFGTNGYVNLRDGLARADSGGQGGGASSRSPGKVWKNLIILGSATGEAFVSPPGDIRAYDVLTGKKVWQFHTVPLPGEFGYETWPKDAYKYVGGANNWGSMSIDDERGIVYIPTGSGTYDFYGADRHGANLFANCLLALDVKTGKRLWHFQTIHHDLWDFDNVSAPMLVTVRHNGKKIDAVAHAGKTGFLYVFNRVTGEPLWPIEERPVPKSEMEGEQAWPTQPFPTKPAPFVRQDFKVEDVNPWLSTPEQYEAMKQRVANARNEGLFTPPGLTDTIQMPGNQGGSNWGTTAADPEKGLAFVVGVNQVAILKLEDVTKRSAAGARGGAQGGNAAVTAGQAVFQQNCQVCHGADLQGVLPGMPSLVGVTDRLADDAIRAVVTGGRGMMRPVSDISPLELTAVIAFLESRSPNAARFGGAGGRGGRGAGPAATFPAGPVVATGGVALPELPTRPAPTPYPGVGGNAGNTPYPLDAADLPPSRYMTDYGVLASFTKPPYTTLTAYDLNTGEIKWQVTNGDDPNTVRAGGPTGTGGVAARNGIVVTKGGLVFQAGGDGKVRAFDEETGKVLWTGAFRGSTAGVPVGYESKGRQYFAMVAGQGGRGGGGGGRGAAPVDESLPTGVIAFALPKK